MRHCEECGERIEDQDPIVCKACAEELNVDVHELLDDKRRLNWIEEDYDSRLLDVRGHLQNNEEDSLRDAIDRLTKLQAEEDLP